MKKPIFPKEMQLWIGMNRWQLGKCEMRLKADGSERKHGLIVSVSRYTSLSLSVPAYQRGFMTDIWFVVGCSTGSEFLLLLV